MCIRDRITTLEKQVAVLEDFMSTVRFIETIPDAGVARQASKPREVFPIVQTSPKGHAFRGCTEFVEFSESIHGLMTRKVERKVDRTFEPQWLEPLEWKVEKLRLRTLIDGGDTHVEPGALHARLLFGLGVDSYLAT